jgi:hypothetical protein
MIDRSRKRVMNLDRRRRMRIVVEIGDEQGGIFLIDSFDAHHSLFPSWSSPSRAQSNWSRRE